MSTYKDSEAEKGKITKILVFPKKKEEEALQVTEDEEAVEEEASRPEPFKFEFDPSEFEERK